MRARLASLDDADDIARIYNEGIADRIGTFETRVRDKDDVRAWFDGKHPIVVVTSDNAARGASIVAFASTSSYRPRTCYDPIAEFSVYVARAARGHGAGDVAMEALESAARDAGLHKLVSRVFVENAPSRALLRKRGFREVGVYEKHGQLDGAWRDVVIVEKLLAR